MGNQKIRKMVMTAILSAVATVLMLIEFSVPLIPSFIKMDFSELPALIAAFSMGPFSGVAVCLLKNLVHLPFSSTGFVGEFANFLLGTCFVLPAGIIYRMKNSRKGALVAAGAGTLFMTLVSVPLNYFVTYPVYQKFMPLEAIIGAYQAIFPGVNGLLQCLLIFNLPFTLVKGILVTAITFLIYKRISPLIKGKYRTHSSEVHDGRSN